MANTKKNYQRKINAVARELNHSLAKDTLWRSRFFVRQVNSPRWYNYEDGSGGMLFVTMRFYDKKTLRYKDVFGDFLEWSMFKGSHMFWEMNNFIVEDCKVWEETPRPTSDTTDYTKITYDEAAELATAMYDRLFSVRY